MMRSRWAPVALALSASLLSLVAVELVLRLSTSPRRYLDRHRDAYWAARCREGLSQHAPGQVEFGNVRLDPQLGWRMRPGSHADGETVDARGLRRTGPALADAASDCRILVLGDSFTYGLGVRDEETYAATLGREHTGCEVLNAGANGWGTDQQYLFWELEGRDYAPDLVVLGLYVPDFHRNGLAIREFPKPSFSLDGDRLVASPEPVPLPTEDCVDERFTGRPRSRLVDAIGSVLRRGNPLGETPERFAWKGALLDAILRELQTSTEAAGAELLVVTIPHNHGRDHPGHAEIEAVIREACERHSISCLDLTEAFADHAASETRMYADNDHWTAAGHRRAAELIAPHLDVARSKGGRLEAAKEGRSP